MDDMDSQGQAVASEDGVPAPASTGDVDVSETEMSDQSQAEPQQDSDSVSLSAIDVPVQFVVGTARVTLADLRRLNEGSLIENAVNRFYPRVVAQVNGRDVAEGEFLDIDGQVGFRVTKILA